MQAARGVAAPPETSLVLIADPARHLLAMVGGEGADLVVLEAGLGGTGAFWGPVHRLLARSARVVAYDRAGYGGSAPGPRPRDLEGLADDLEVVLDAYEHERLVLVGHSWGGPIVRTVAARRRSDRRVAGLVLVDQSDEHADLYFSRSMRAQSVVQDALLEPLARLGLLRPLLGLMAREVPREVRAAILDASSSRQAAATMRAENRHVTAGLRRLRDDPPDLGDLPVRVISGRRSSRFERAGRDALSRAHRRTADALAGGAYVEALRSGHMVPLTEPELVAAQAIELLRASPPWPPDVRVTP